MRDAPSWASSIPQEMLDNYVPQPDDGHLGQDVLDEKMRRRWKNTTRNGKIQLIREMIASSNMASPAAVTHVFEQILNLLAEYP